MNRDHTEARAERLDAMAAQLERLLNFVEVYATCPCCDGVDECDAECTFAKDCPGDVEKMQMARDAITGD